jgi:uncharacterized iron-regulated membrane protein
MHHDLAEVGVPASAGASRPFDEAAAAAPSSALYRAVWRWHFYAGLVCLPFLVTMAITGGLYLFRVEVESIVYRDLLQVPASSGARRSAEALVATALDAQGGAATRYVPPPTPGRSAEVGLTLADGTAVSAYLDPHSGRLLGVVRDDRKLMQVIKGLHSLAIAGTVANHWIEVVAGWAIVLVVTGVVLWWPRGRSGGVVSVRGRPRGRIWWRDAHAVTGVVGAGAILFLAVTGMPWSAFWGQQFNAYATRWGLGVPTAVWAAAPQSTVPAAHHAELPWTLSRTLLPESPSAMPAHMHPIGLDAALRVFDRLALEPGYSVALPVDAHGVYSATLFPDDATRERVVHVDQYSGRPLIDIAYRDYGPVGKATEWGIAVHTGRQYGLANQLVMLAGCIAIVILAMSAVVMWWKRRPAGQLAAPRRADGERVARTVVVIAALLGIIYPLLGVSMLVALAIELLVPARWRWRFGL